MPQRNAAKHTESTQMKSSNTTAMQQVKEYKRQCCFMCAVNNKRFHNESFNRLTTVSTFHDSYQLPDGWLVG